MPTISPPFYSQRHLHMGIRDKPNVGMHLSHTPTPTHTTPTKEHFVWNEPESGDDAKTATNTEPRSN